MPSRALTRRAVVAGASVLTAAALAGCGGGAPSAGAAATGRLRETRIGNAPFTLTAQQRSVTLAADSGPTSAWLYGDGVFPVYRLTLGEAVEAKLVNRLDEHTSIHWHGVR